MRRMSTPTQRRSIGRSTGRCAVTGAALEPGTPCVAALIDRGDQGLERLDYSTDAWQAAPRPEGLLGFWRTIVPVGEERRGIVIDDEVLESMLARLEGDDRPDRVAFRWLVALMLLRKRRLRHLGVERREGREWWRFAWAGRDAEAPLLEILNPHLAEEDLRSLAEQLGEFVDADLE